MNNKALAAVAVVSALGLASLTPVPSQARMGGGMHGMHGGFGGFRGGGFRGGGFRGGGWGWGAGALGLGLGLGALGYAASPYYYGYDSPVFGGYDYPAYGCYGQYYGWYGPGGGYC